MKSNTFHSKSSLVLALAFMALLFNACRKSSSSMEVAPNYKLDCVVGYYIATDTMLKNNSFPSTVYDTSYQTISFNVSARSSCMVQFDNILSDQVSYTCKCYKWDTVCTSYEYYTSSNPSSYSYPGSNTYKVVVRFKGDTMYYSTNSNVDRTMHKGTAIKR